MRTRTILRWMMGIALLGGGITLYATRALAERRLEVRHFQNTCGACQSDPAGNLYYAEAFGFGNLGEQQCHVAAAAIGGTSASTCLLAVSHEARLTTRNSAHNQVSTLLTTPRQNTWTNSSQIIHFTTPATATCAAGTAIDIVSRGYN
jgi:hypothetical protein